MSLTADRNGEYLVEFKQFTFVPTDTLDAE